MFSFGIEYERAFSIAFCSARLAAGSGPPSRAATMIARASFENSFPRFASAAPFLCLIDDHLLCPDIALLLHGGEEQFVDSRVVGQLRVEGGDDEPPLAQQHRLPVELGEDFDLRACLANSRRADEDASQRGRLPGEGEVCFEARDLPAEGVAIDLEIDRAEVIAVQDDHARAGPEHGAGELAHGLIEAVEAHQTHERRRLATRDHEPLEALELFGLADLDSVSAETAQHRGMLAEI